MIKKMTALLAISAFSFSALAQETTTTIDETVEASRPKPARQMLQVDLIPTAISATSAGMPGIGLIYSFRLGNNFSIGAFGELSYIQDAEGILFYRDIEFQRIKYGLELRGYISQFGQGFYGAIGPAFSNLEATTEARRTNAANFEASDSIDQNGFLARLGYTIGSRKKTNSIIIDVALEYGAGNTWEYSGDTNGRFDVDALSNGLGLNVGLGARF